MRFLLMTSIAPVPEPSTGGLAGTRQRRPDVNHVETLGVAQ